MQNELENSPQTKSSIVSRNKIILITSIVINLTLIILLFIRSNLTAVNNAPKTPTPTSITTQPSTATNTNSNKNTHILIDSCNADQCLFESEDGYVLEGYGILEGYYEKAKRMDWGDIEVECDTLIVTGGSEPLINHLKDWAGQGNMINRIDQNNNLQVNINLSSEADKNTIYSSTISNPIKLSVIRDTPQGRGAAACESFVEIIKVE